jgi:hypothetical protein
VAGYPDVVRTEMSILPELTIICGLAVGYSDPDFPANKLPIGRDPVAKHVVFLDNLIRGRTQVVPIAISLLGKVDRADGRAMAEISERRAPITPRLNPHKAAPEAMKALVALKGIVTETDERER